MTSEMDSGAAYVPSLDKARLSLQIERIRLYLLPGEWKTLLELKAALEAIYAPAHFPEASLSAQLRNLRKEPYRLRVERRRREGVHGPGAGIWEYRLSGREPEPQLGLFIEPNKCPEPVAPCAESRCEPDDGKGREEFFRVARRIAGLS
jgi:hypothetical protein